MVSSKKSRDPYLDLNEPDPYLSMNGDVEEKEVPRKKVLSKDSKDEPRDREPDTSAMRAVATAMQALVKKMDDIATRPVKPPVVNVEAPKVTVAAPEVNITQKTPKKLRFRVTDRDEMGRIKDITVTVLE